MDLDFVLDQNGIKYKGSKGLSMVNLFGKYISNINLLLNP